MNKYQKLASNTFVLALGQFGSKFLVDVMLRFYTSWLGADGFGDVNNIINASALLISVVTLSINEGVLRYALDDTIRKKNHVLSIGINVALIGLVIFAAFVPLIGMIDMLSGYQWLIYMYVATGSIKGICAIYVRARGRVGLYAIDGTLTTIVVILLNILLLGVLHLGVVGYVLSISLGDMISIVFLTWRAGLLRQYRPLGNDRGLAKGMIHYSVPLMPTAVMWWIINVSDTFMVTAIHGSAANGVYSFAYKFPNLAALVVGIFSQAWHMSAITERNSRKVSEFWDKMQRYLFGTFKCFDDQVKMSEKFTKNNSCYESFVKKQINLVNEMNDDKKIDYFAMLTRCFLLNEMENDLYYKLARFINMCTSDELDYIRDFDYNNRSKINAVISSLYQYGLFEQSESNDGADYVLSGFAKALKNNCLNYDEGLNSRDRILSYDQIPPLNIAEPTSFKEIDEMF